ncbi:MAG: hypothetical protein K2X06_07755 [Burkholderiales bacterium]|nr:hypothetical protein [Burkholderiales bacterium]
MNSDFKDLLSAFNANSVEYLIVGAYALAAHGRVRATGDIDIWVRAAPANARRVIKALTEFGAPLQDLDEHDLSHPGLVFQIGIAPLRIDILTHIDGVEFDDAWAARLNIQVAEQPVGVLSQAHLIKNKRTVGRAQDLADIEWLERPDRDDR